ncbi:MAG TPA: efflux RND transporter periplasmic adaptor subunit [Planctomycetota bacterium]|nr:efflux RND transporter periplasmic adaptor subunit [Planctomycetota bacterium]
MNALRPTLLAAFAASALAAACSKEPPVSTRPSLPLSSTETRPVRAPRSGAVLALSADAIRDLRLTTRPVERRAASETLVAPGSLELDPNEVRAVASPLPGRIARIERQIGDEVAAGETLVELESIELGRTRASLEGARARVGIATKRLDLARRQRERIAELATARMATVREQLSAEAEAAAREADLAEAEVAARNAERALAVLGAGDGEGGRIPIPARAGGVVIERDGVEGQAVAAEHVFFRVAKLSPLVAVVHPFEREGARIDAAAQVRLAAAAHPARSFDAAILRAGPLVDRASRTLPLRLVVPNPEGLLRPGMSVTAFVRLADPQAQEVATVPLAAVQRVDRDWCVFVPLGGGRFERRAIARGRDLGAEVEILSGVEPGEDVVVEGAFVLRAESTRGAEAGDEHGH